MGAWDCKPFDNDFAMDWLGQLEGHAEPRHCIERALGRISSGASDADDASVAVAVAAGEVVKGTLHWKYGH